MIFKGLAHRGRLHLPPEATGYLSRYEGEPFLVDLAPLYARRTGPQNRRLWAGYTRALRSFAALSGHSREELHDAMKDRFIEPVRLYTAGGELIGRARSTRQLSVPAFGDYMEQVCALFAGWGCDLYPGGRP